MSLNAILDPNQRRTLREGILHALSGTSADLQAWGYAFTFQHDPLHESTGHDDELALCFLPRKDGNRHIYHEIDVFLSPTPQSLLSPFQSKEVIELTRETILQEIRTPPAGWICIRYLGLRPSVPYLPAEGSSL